MNDLAESLYGWRYDEAMGLSILDITEPQMSWGQAEKIMADLAQGNTWTGEMFVKHRNGKTFPVEVNDTSVFDEKGMLLGIISISSDINERKQVDDALRESNRLLNFSMQYGHMGSWKLNLVDHSS